MVRDQTYSKRLVRCWAVIGSGADSEEYDVVNLNAEFSLNSIPTATATVALGRDVNLAESSSYTGRAASINEKFLFRKPVKVFASYILQSESPDIADITVASFDSKLVFEGYVAGFGFQRTSAAAVLTISMEHWLSDLSAATMLSTSTHAATPADLQKAALMRSATTAAFTSPGKATFLSTSWILDAAGDPATICSDLWENGIKKVILKAAGTDNLADLNRKVQFSCSESDTFNQAALAAIPKITSKNAPLNITLFSADGSDLGRAIVSDLSNVYLENLAGQTIWDCIIASSGNYMFAIVPHVSTAEVVPFCPVAVSEEPFASILSNQIESISVSGDCPRTLRGVAVVFPQAVVPLLGEDEPPFPPDLAMGGVFMSPSSGCKGTVLFKHPPSWLGIDYSYYSTGIDKNVVPTTVNPEDKQKSDKKPLGELQDEFSGIRNAYAKSLYSLEIIKGRQGTISGPLRFDIGVGSQIEFELPEDYHAPSAQQNKYFYGVVVRVSFTIDANSSVASTTFVVAHIRTYAEEYNKNFTMDKHPMYENKWIGSALDAQ